MHIVSLQLSLACLQPAASSSRTLVTDVVQWALPASVTFVCILSFVCVCVHHHQQQVGSMHMCTHHCLSTLSMLESAFLILMNG